MLFVELVVVDVMLIPLIESVDAEAGAVRFPIRLLETVLVVPADKRIPLTSVEIPVAPVVMS